MPILLVTVIPAIPLVVMVLLVRRYIRRKELTPHRFAIIFSIGIGSATFALFVMGVLAAQAPLTLSLLLLGSVIALLNIVVGYPIAYLSYRFILKSLTDRLKM